MSVSQPFALGVVLSTLCVFVTHSQGFAAWLGDISRNRARTRVRPDRPGPISPRLSPPPAPAPDVQLRAQERPRIRVQCGEATVRVSVDRLYFGEPGPVSAASLRLGEDPRAPGSCTPEPTASVPGAALVITARLHECGSVSRVTPQALVYLNKLVYSPSPAGGVLERASPVLVPLECHYRRKHRVSSEAVRPTWLPFTSTRSAGGLLRFSLRTMNEDWGSPRLSSVFYLGETVRLEAAVSSQGHPPLRLFVDRCVATLTPDPDSSPSYAVIDHHGCLLDGTTPGSPSAFRSPRIRPEILQFSMVAFRFLRDTRSELYLTCHLKAMPADRSPDPVNKACSFSHRTRSWAPLEGRAGVCSCCRTGSCSEPSRGSGQRSGSHLPFAEGGEMDTGLGPLQVLPYSRWTASLAGAPRAHGEGSTQAGLLRSPPRLFPWPQ
ncbi:zona pellucida sperm-binding protein 3-like isoform X2 [Lepisosteus oculatus]|uniref:zona pellucida sperm-binding protein 3-like isoform X2 n=1 Tax=Lepisosteus oculatus TaxID=7918 RepID=UPI003716BD04